MPEAADPAMLPKPFTNYQAYLALLQQESLAGGEAELSSLALPLSLKLQKKKTGDQKIWFQCLSCHNLGETLE